MFIGGENNGKGSNFFNLIYIELNSYGLLVHLQFKPYKWCNVGMGRVPKSNPWVSSLKRKYPSRLGFLFDREMQLRDERNAIAYSFSLARGSFQRRRIT
jgi:hypothetical protein